MVIKAIAVSLSLIVVTACAGLRAPGVRNAPGRKVSCADRGHFLIVDSSGKDNRQGNVEGDIWEIWDFGAKRKRITDDHASWGPALSPDGKRVLFTSARHAEYYDGHGYTKAELYEYDLETRTERLVQHGSDLVWADWSPDGRRYVVTLEQPPRYPKFFFDDHLAIVDVATGRSRWVIQGNERLGHTTPAWSPDGKYIAYQRQGPRTGAVWIVRPDGTGARPLSGTHTAGPESWSPNGQQIVVQDLDGLAVVEVATGKVKARMANVEGGAWTSDSTIEFIKWRNPNGSDGAHMYKWDLSTGRVTRSSATVVIREAGVESLRLVPFPCDPDEGAG